MRWSTHQSDPSKRQGHEYFLKPPRLGIAVLVTVVLEFARVPAQPDVRSDSWLSGRRLSSRSEQRAAQSSPCTLPFTRARGRWIILTILMLIATIVSALIVWFALSFA